MNFVVEASVSTTYQSISQLSCWYAGDSKEWEMAVNLNLTAAMLLTQAFAEGMVKNKVCMTPPVAFPVLHNDVHVLMLWLQLMLHAF